MIRVIRYGMVVICSLLLSPLGFGQNLLKYRDFEFGMNVETVLNQTKMDAASAKTTIRLLEAQVGAYNDLITQSNSTIASLNQFVSEVSSASSAAIIANISARYNAAIAAGSFPSQSDVITYQQNRTTLQSQLASTNQATAAGITQCNAASEPI